MPLILDSCPARGECIAQKIGVYRDISYNRRHFSANPKGGLWRDRTILSDFSGKRPDKSDARNRIAKGLQIKVTSRFIPVFPGFYESCRSRC